MSMIVSLLSGQPKHGTLPTLRHKQRINSNNSLTWEHGMKGARVSCDILDS